MTPPLLDGLSFSAGNANWGWDIRKGFFEITEADFDKIATATNEAEAGRR